MKSILLDTNAYAAFKQGIFCSMQIISESVLLCWES